MKPAPSQEAKEILARISKDRTRTNLLKNPEQKAMAVLVRIPSWVHSDMLTLTGFQEVLQLSQALSLQLISTGTIFCLLLQDLQ